MIGIEERLLAAAAAEFNVTVKQILGINRYMPLPEARAIISYLAITDYGMTQRKAGAITGRDHASALYHRDKIVGYLEMYPETRSIVASIRERVETAENIRPFHILATQYRRHGE